MSSLFIGECSEARSLGDMNGQIHETVAITPFIIVPSNQLDEVIV